MCSCAIRKILNVEPLLRIETYQLGWFDRVTRMSQETLVRRFLADKPMEKRLRVRPTTRWHEYTSDLAWSVLLWSQQNYQWLLKMWGIRDLLGLLPTRPSRNEKPASKWKNEWIKDGMRHGTFINALTKFTRRIYRSEYEVNLHMNSDRLRTLEEMDHPFDGNTLKHRFCMMHLSDAWWLMTFGRSSKGFLSLGNDSNCWKYFLVFVMLIDSICVERTCIPSVVSKLSLQPF